MVVCIAPYYFPDSFLVMGLVFMVGAIVLTMLLSGVSFYHLYYKASFSRWQYKSNKKYPEPSYVRLEVIKTFKACFWVSILPLLGIYLQGTTVSFQKFGGSESYFERSPVQYFKTAEESSISDLHVDSEIMRLKFQGYCGLENTSYLTMFLQFLVTVLLTDFVEFLYHYMGHKIECLWQVHKHHHNFYNPTPFAVIADEAMDNIFRSASMLLVPMVIPINLDVLYLTFVIFFYGYGVYLHSGYEADWIVRSDHPIMNTSFQHYVHHAVGTRMRPYHCGFFIKLWDQILGSCYDGVTEKCAKEQRDAGKRNKGEWMKHLEKFPNYALLKRVDFWRNPKKYKAEEYIDAREIKVYWE